MMTSSDCGRDKHSSIKKELLLVTIPVVLSIIVQKLADELSGWLARKREPEQQRKEEHDDNSN